MSVGCVAKEEQIAGCHSLWSFVPCGAVFQFDGHAAATDVPAGLSFSKCFCRFAEAYWAAKHGMVLFSTVLTSCQITVLFCHSSIDIHQSQFLCFCQCDSWIKRR